MKISRETWILIGILLLGLALRGMYLLEIAKSENFEIPGVDAGYHDYWARALVSGDWSVPEHHQDPEIQTTPYFRSPGYSYFLAMIYLLSPSYLGPRLAQMLLGLLSCVLAYRLGKRWFGGATGLIFAGLMSVYWVFIFSEGELLEPPVLLPLGLLLMHELSLWTEKVNVRRAVFAGVIMGLFALVRPNILLFGPAVLVWGLWLGMRRGNLRYAWGGVLVLGLTCAATIAPATIRNYIVAKDLVPISSNSGINLYIGNNERASGLCAVYFEGLGKFEGCYDYPDLLANVEKRVGRPMKHSEASDYFTRQAVEYIKENPGHALRLAAKKSLMFWGPVEVGHNKEEELEKINSRVLRYLPIRFSLVLALAVAGAAAALTRIRRTGNKDCVEGRQLEVLALAALFVGTYFITYVPYFVAGRYRVPIVPFLMLFGAYGITNLARMVVSREFVRVGVLTAVFAGALALASVNFGGYEPSLAKWHYDRGVDFAFSGKGDLAFREYRKALELKPDFPQAHLNYGLILLDRGEIEEAILHFRESISLHDDHRAHYNLGRALGMQGKTDEAIVEYREALRIQPNYHMAHYDLGLAMLSQGKVSEAIASFEDCVEARPDYAPGYGSLAIVYENEGNVEKAVEYYRKALAIVSDAGLHTRLAEVLVSAGRLEEATADFRKAVELKREDPVLHYNLAVALDRQEDLDEAIKHYSEAVRLKPDYIRALNNLAVAQFRAGKYAEAWRSVEVSRRHGGKPHPEFLKALSERMPEPR